MPIRIKIMGIILGLVVVLGVGITWQVRRTLESTLTDELHLRAVSIASDLAARGADNLLTSNIFALHQLTGETLANNPDVRYAFVADPSGQVLVHTFGEHFPADLLAVHRVPLQGSQSHLVLLDSDEGPLLDVAVPILGGRAGVARVGLTQRRMQAAVEAITAELLLATAFVSLIGVAAAYVLTLLLTAPVLELVQVTRSIEAGDFARRARVWASDEIGWLAQAINAMAASLLSSRRDLEASHALALRRNRELTMLNAVAARLAEGFDARRLTLDALEEIVRQLGLRRGAAVHFDPATGRIAWRAAVRNLTPPSPNGAASDAGSALPFRVPLVTRNHELGVLLLWGSPGQPVADADRPLLLAAGQQIAVAVENAHLWEEVQRKEALRGQLLAKVIGAQEEERKRIARELHDETSQALTSVMVGLRLIENRTADPESQSLVGSVRGTVAATLDGVRQLARDLRPSVLDDLGLAAALDRYVGDYGRQHPFAADFHGVGLRGLRLAPSVETALYRIAQEALTNAARHARPASVSVVLERRGDTLILIVEDDGRGFDVAAATGRRPEQQLGLHGMRERAELLGARLTIESGPGAGTTVFVELPLDAALGREQRTEPTAEGQRTESTAETQRTQR
ncbi:MAG: HAMP domain-containing protein [Chloroflexi bacterium]|nr:HAMP domain-containing protein [Chloroflexota bacterium]